MFNVIKARIMQGYRTGKFPAKAPVLPDKFKGVLKRDPQLCSKCGLCDKACPTGALTLNGGRIDLGKCIFCGKCQESCKDNALSFTKEYRLGALSREKLIHNTDDDYIPDTTINKIGSSLFKKSLKIREVSAGGCAACELDFNVLHTLAWDMGRFGIAAVASPRHADAVLVTGPVSQNMLLALKKTIDAMPQPALIVACGACAISGGIYGEHEECHSGLDKIIKVDLYIPGCPPHPTTTLDALLALQGRRRP